MPADSTIDLDGTSNLGDAQSLGNTHNGHPAKQTVKQRFLRYSADDALPLRLTHERIYILPTSRGWVFVLTLLIMLVTSINYALSLGYALCFLLTGLFSATLLATYKNVAGITLERVNGRTGVAGIGTEFSLTFSNSRKQDCVDLLIKSEVSDEAYTTLAAGDSQTVKLPVKAKARGWKKLGRITLSSDYPLGLWKTWGYIHTPVESLIWPAPEAPAPAIPAPKPRASDAIEAASVTTSYPTNQGEFSGLRPYREGDSVTSIAWKQTARGQGLLSREFEENASTKIALCWHDSHAAGDTEARISRLAAWCDECLSYGLDFSLTLQDQTVIKKEPGESLSQHRSNCLKALALCGSTAPATAPKPVP